MAPQDSFFFFSWQTLFLNAKLLTSFNFQDLNRTPCPSGILPSLSLHTEGVLPGIHTHSYPILPLSFCSWNLSPHSHCLSKSKQYFLSPLHDPQCSGHIGIHELLSQRQLLSSESSENRILPVTHSVQYKATWRNHISNAETINLPI